MKAPDDLTLAKQILADQQIMISRLLAQTRSSFVYNPNGELVHVACSSPLLVDEGNIIPGCECFES